MNYKKVFAWYSPVFIICLALMCWLMYYFMFLKDNFTLTTAYIDEMTYSDEEKFFIEVKYFPNMFEARLNYYTDNDIPEKNDDGTYPNKYTYSSGVQFDGGYQYKRECYTNEITYDYYYNKMINCTYYNASNDGTTYEAISKLENQNHWVYDIEGQLCLIEEKGNVTESYFLWVRQGNRYDTSLMLQDLYNSVKSLEDGTRVIAFDLSRYYNIKFYDGKEFKEDPNKTTETFMFVNIKVEKSSNDFVSANQSMFGKFKGDSTWTLYDFEKADYWRARHEYNFGIEDFTIAYENNGYYLKLQQNTINFFSAFSNMTYFVTIDLDNIYLGNDKLHIEGFTDKPFVNLTIEKITLKTDRVREFKVYSNYNIEAPTNLTIELVEVVA